MTDRSSDLRSPGRDMAGRTGARRWVAVAIVGLVMASSVGADAQSDDDLRAERERLREEQAAVAAEVDVAQAETDEILDALDALEANVRAEEAQLDDAERAVAAAEEQVQEARAAQAAAEARVEELREQMARMAVDAYVNPPDQDHLTIVLTGDLGTAPERQALFEMSASNQADVMERYRAAVEDLEIQTQTAQSAQERAEESRNEVERRLASVAVARDDQAALAAQAQLRLDEMLQEELRLEEAEDAITTELAERERQRQAELQAALARASARRGPANVPGHGSIELVTVGGITVNAEIADQLGAMLQAAAADGITLTGGGYRDSAQQIALRRSHCGTSNFAVYEMSPSRCRPPTARPGQSLHERGLAIDFVANGRSITSRSHAGFQWLAANASSYGFYNLPSEPWHWSTTGG